MADVKERPILFSAPMVRALLDGRKTQTRRVVKPQPHRYVREFMLLDTLAEFKPVVGGPSNLFELPEMAKGSPTIRCPYGKPGDRLWVREAWRVHRDYDGLRSAGIYAAMGGDVAYCIRYENDGRSEEGWEGRRRVGRFMPRWASRITLEMTEV